MIMVATSAERPLNDLDPDAHPCLAIAVCEARFSYRLKIVLRAMMP
jgi:hypothetical protein